VRPFPSALTVVAPVFQRLATQYPEAVFVKVDVDKQQQTAQSYKVTAMYPASAPC
jgi:thiol-disulfide isomerase/thioredoxin